MWRLDITIYQVWMRLCLFSCKTDLDTRIQFGNCVSKKRSVTNRTHEKAFSMIIRKSLCHSLTAQIQFDRRWLSFQFLIIVNPSSKSWGLQKTSFYWKTMFTPLLDHKSNHKHPGCDCRRILHLQTYVMSDDMLSFASWVLQRIPAANRQIKFFRRIQHHHPVFSDSKTLVRLWKTVVDIIMRKTFLLCNILIQSHSIRIWLWGQN